MYYVIEVDGFMRSCIDTQGRPNKYGTPKVFRSRKAAQHWIDAHSYKGMSFHYEIKEVGNGEADKV